MVKMPKKAVAYLSNAKYYLNAAHKIPNDLVGARIYLLLIAWENCRLAEEELHTWAGKTPRREKIYRSHTLKLDDVRKPIIELVEQPDGKILEKDYLSSKELSKLLETCRYGKSGGETELRAYFSSKKFTRWHTDDFERGLDSKIAWAEALIEALKGIES